MQKELEELGLELLEKIENISIWYMRSIRMLEHQRVTSMIGMTWRVLCWTNLQMIIAVECINIS